MISDVVIGGTNLNRFALADGQPTSFTIPPASRRPCRPGSGPGFAFGVNVGHADPLHERPAEPDLRRGAPRRERGRDGRRHRAEPERPHVDPRLLDRTGVNGTFQATTRAPVGDEVIAPYFKRVDPSKPVGLYPVARYVAATSFTSDTGYAPTKYSGARTTLYRFPADTSTTPPTTGSTPRRSPRTRS